MIVLDDERVRDELRNAWKESSSGTPNAHEEGGFVVQDEQGRLVVKRWPQGSRKEIVVPPHADGRFDGRLILATFHTHPNPGPEFQQEPSLTDVRAVRNDPGLRHPEFEGELVISTETIYRILPDGSVERVGKTDEVLQVKPARE